MAGPGGAAQRPEKKKRGVAGWLVAGIVIGALGAIFLPELADPYLPDALRGGDVEVAGVVEAEAMEGEELLLTVSGAAGATLLTFHGDDVARIGQLVAVGDSVRLAVDEYRPFIDDAVIRRVVKPRDWRAGEADAIAPDTTTPGDTTAPGDTTRPGDTTAPGDTTRPADTTAPGDTATEAADEVPPDGAP